MKQAEFAKFEIRRSSNREKFIVDRSYRELVVELCELIRRVYDVHGEPRRARFYVNSAHFTIKRLFYLGELPRPLARPLSPNLPRRAAVNYHNERVT